MFGDFSTVFKICSYLGTTSTSLNENAVGDYGGEAFEAKAHPRVPKGAHASRSLKRWFRRSLHDLELCWKTSIRKPPLGEKSRTWLVSLNKDILSVAADDLPSGAGTRNTLC